MTDGDEEISYFHADLMTQGLPTQYTADASESRHREADHHTLNYSADASESRQSETDPYALRLGVKHERFVDDIIGLPLDEVLCRIARQKAGRLFQKQRSMGDQVDQRSSSRDGTSTHICQMGRDQQRRRRKSQHSQSIGSSRNPASRPRCDICHHSAIRIAEDDPQHGLDEVRRRKRLTALLGSREQRQDAALDDRH